MDKAARLNLELTIACRKAAGLQLPVGLLEQGHDHGGRDVVCGHARFVQSHANLSSLSADELNFRDIGDFLDLIVNLSSDTAILSFDDMRVPKANRIGEEGKGFYLQMQQFQVERLAGVIMSISGMERAINMTIDYCRQRQAFGQPDIGTSGQTDTA